MGDLLADYSWPQSTGQSTQSTQNCSTALEWTKEYERRKDSDESIEHDCPLSPTFFSLPGQMILSESLLNQDEGSNSSTPSWGSFLGGIEPEDPFLLLDDEVHFEAVYDPFDYSPRDVDIAPSSTDITAHHDLKDPLLLENHWVFLYDERTPRGLTEHDYESSIITLGSFNTVQDFWCWWNTLIALKLPDYFNLRIFKQGVRPLWEDPANKSGGKWAFSMPKAHRERVWTEAAMILIGEQLDQSEDLCGIVFSARPKADVVHIWNARVYDDDTIDDITKQIRKIMGFDRNVVIEYTPHKPALQQNQKLIRKAHSQKSSAKSSSSNSRNNSRRSSLAPRATPDHRGGNASRSGKGTPDEIEPHHHNSHHHVAQSPPMSPKSKARGLSHRPSTTPTTTEHGCATKRSLFSESSETPPQSSPISSLLTPVKVLSRNDDHHHKRASVVFVTSPHSNSPSEHPNDTAHEPSGAGPRISPSPVEGSIVGTHSAHAQPCHHHSHQLQPILLPVLHPVPNPPRTSLLSALDCRHHEALPPRPQLIPVIVPPSPAPSLVLKQLAEDIVSLEKSISDVEITLRQSQEQDEANFLESSPASPSSPLDTILKNALEEISKVERSVEEKIPNLPNKSSESRKKASRKLAPPVVATKKVKDAPKKPSTQKAPKLAKRDFSSSLSPVVSKLSLRFAAAKQRAHCGIDLESPAVLMTQYIAGAALVIFIVVYLS